MLSLVGLPFFGRPAYSASYLVVGAGGGGESFHSGTNWGGGGDGGQVQSGSKTLTPGTTYNITIGTGGAGGTGTSGANGANGGDSAFDEVTAAGGPGGGTVLAYNAGRGNGGANARVSQFLGGIGVSSSITGSSLGYGGGGAQGNNQVSSPPDNGASYGGGLVRNDNAALNTPPAANRGGGGGGGQNPSDGGGRTSTGQAGASGVVILSVPTNSYSGVYTGSPSISTSGGNTILTFTGSGSYRA